MSPVDVETVNERLNGLVNLLKAVGVDESGNANNYGSNGKRNNNNNNHNHNNTIPDARQLDDHQIAAIIQKLQMAQSEAPQIIAALEAQAKLKQKQRQQQQVEEEEDEEEVVEEEEEDDDDEDSYNDDDDGNYPMVGPGCSDDVSVVSDLTTPTVVQNPHVNDEEHYRDNHHALPPMLIIGGGGGNHNNNYPQSQQHPPMLIAPTKRKNLVGSVRANTLATAPLRNNGTTSNGIKAPSSHKGNGGIMAPSTPGSSSSNGKGAAAQRRKAYNATMERLTQDGGGGGVPSSSYPLSPARSHPLPAAPAPPQPLSSSARKMKSTAPQPSSNNHSPQYMAGQESFNNHLSTPVSNKDATRKKVARRASLSSGHVPNMSQQQPPPTASSFRTMDNSNINNNGWDVPPGWDAFQPKTASSKSAPSKPMTKKNTSSASRTASLIDDDGFLIAPTADFDPFAVAVTMPNNNSSRQRKSTDSKSVSSGSRRSNGSDPKPDTNVQRRVKKPSSSSGPQQMQPPQAQMPSKMASSGYNTKNPHFIDQPTSMPHHPQQRTRPQPQQSMMTNDSYPPPPQQQQAKVRRSQRRASLGV